MEEVADKVSAGATFSGSLAMIAALDPEVSTAGRKRLGLSGTVSLDKERLLETLLLQGLWRRKSTARPTST